MGNSRSELAQEQIETLESEIAALRAGHKALYERKYGEFFSHAKSISQLFKNSNALPRSERQRLWEEFSGLCDEVRQESERAKEARANNSRVKRSGIESDIREAYYWAKGSNHISDLQEAERRLQAITERMKDGWDAYTLTTDFFESIGGNDGRLTKEDRDYLWDKWREAKAMVRERRAWLSELHYDHMRSVASECLSLAYSDARAAKERIKRANEEMKQHPMNSEQYSHIRENLDQAWKMATETGSQRHREWRERNEDHIERWVKLHEKNEDVIASLEQQIEECEELESNARSDDFASRVRGWIEEKMQKIRDIRRTNEDLEERIESVKRKLSE